MGGNPSDFLVGVFFSSSASFEFICEESGCGGPLASFEDMAMPRICGWDCQQRGKEGKRMDQKSFPLLRLE